MPYSQTSPSPALFITSTSDEHKLMAEGFIDRMTYKLVFQPLDLNSFHKVTQYVIKKVLCEPYIHLKSDNYVYINHSVANQSIGQLIKKMALNIQTKGGQNYLQNNRLMRTLKIAIRDSKNLNKVSKYQQQPKQQQNKNKNLWYFK